MLISVVIPCYNVSMHIAKVISGIPDNISWIIAVNDCSTDDTDNILTQLQETNDKLIYLKHEKNQGVGGAMITGFKKSIALNCDITIKMDGDNQMDSAYIPLLIKPLLENRADFTKGNRFRDFSALRRMPIIRRIGNLGLSFMIKAASGYWNIYDPSNGYIAIKNDTLKIVPMDKLHNRFFFETSLLLELYYTNAVIEEIPMQAQYGNEESNLSIIKTLFEFPSKLFFAFIKRMLLKYFLFEFNMASVYILFGVPLFSCGTILGIKNYIMYANVNTPAPTGTVVIPTLLIILGFQLLLSAINYDITNYPRK